MLLRIQLVVHLNLLARSHNFESVFDGRQACDRTDDVVRNEGAAGPTGRWTPGGEQRKQQMRWAGHASIRDSDTSSIHPSIRLGPLSQTCPFSSCQATKTVCFATYSYLPIDVGWLR